LRPGSSKKLKPNQFQLPSDQILHLELKSKTKRKKEASPGLKFTITFISSRKPLTHCSYLHKLCSQQFFVATAEKKFSLPAPL